MNKGMQGRALAGPVSRDERLRWARDAVRHAEVHALAKPDDRALQLALAARRAELAALEAGRKR